jgi:signal recognition particle subunit SRP54
MLEKLGAVLKKATDKITNAIFLDKNLVDTIVRDLQRALIEADVNVVLVKKLSDKIKKVALDERVKGIEKKEHLIKLLHDELINILGKEKKLELKTEQNRIMLLGLYGAGKTTTISKLGNYYAKRGKKVALIGLDVHRPAAKEQLMQLAEKNKLTAFVDMEENNAVETWKKFKPKLKDYDLILIDTAGRHNLDEELVKEIKELGKQIKPTETILVMPADIGQAAKDQAEAFQKALNITGVIITRMDSTAKAGGALTACAETNAGVYFIATGEKINDLEEFNPESFLSRLLGMGDLQTLIEKIKSVTNQDEQEEMQKRLEQGKISLEDVIEQVKSMNSLGGFDKIKSMIPGMNSAKIPENMLDNQQQKIAKWEHILKSMTKEEKENPELLEKQTTRIKRIAQGAGVHGSDVRSLLKQYKMLQELVKGGSDMDMSQGMSQKQMMKLAKKFGKGKKFKL